MVGQSQTEPSVIRDPLGLNGRRVAHFEVLEILGAGGMGVVYRAKDLKLERNVALKFLGPLYNLNELARKRFMREAKAVASLDHPNICAIYEVGTTQEDWLFMSMALYSGETLRERLHRDGPISVTSALSIAYQVAKGLQAAHAARILHRDLKPANIMLLPDGTARILDFGVAKMQDQPVTETAGVVGTVSYMSPEQVRGEQLDQRTDLWSLGVILYEMLTGERPFGSAESFAVARSIILDDPPPLSRARPDIPLALEDIVVRLLEKDSSRRYTDAQELLNALSEPAASATETGRSFRRRARDARRKLLKHKRAVFATLVGAIALIAVAVGLSMRESRAAAPAPIRSIVVMPFENRSRVPNQQYLTQGIHDAALTELSRTNGLRVISPISAMQYTGTTKSVAQVARELGVDALVRGAIERVADSVRVQMELVRAFPAQRLVWSKRFTTSMNGVLAEQRDIAREIAAQTAAREIRNLTSNPNASRTTNPEAQDAYLRGRFYQSDWSEEGARNSITLFRRATTLDSNWAPPYAGLAQSKTILFAWGRLPPEEFYPEARSAANRALALDSASGEAHSQLATLEFYEWRWKDAESHFQRALQLSPGTSRVHSDYAYYLEIVGRSLEAIQQRRVALDLDPLSPAENLGLSLAYLRARRYGEAETQLRRAIELYPRVIAFRLFLGLTHVQQRRFGQAVVHTDSALALVPTSQNTDAFALGIGAWLYASAGQRARAAALQARLEQLATRTYVDPIYRSMFFIAVHDSNSALLWIEKGMRNKTALSVLLKSDPWLDPIRLDPRFSRLIEQMQYPT